MVVHSEIKTSEPLMDFDPNLNPEEDLLAFDSTGSEAASDQLADASLASGIWGFPLDSTDTEAASNQLADESLASGIWGFPLDSTDTEAASNQLADESLASGIWGFPLDSTDTEAASNQLADESLASGIWGFPLDSTDTEAASNQLADESLASGIWGLLSDSAGPKVASTLINYAFDTQGGLITDTSVCQKETNHGDSFYPYPDQQDLYSPLIQETRQSLHNSDVQKSEIVHERKHEFYSLPQQKDGKYHCPFATEENPCSHPPTTQKFVYDKYLDSHLKPYMCKDPACADQHFSSKACLFRHQREIHGLHGHGDNPYLCLFEDCDRAVSGYGFPRRWNLYDHMQRVHDYKPDESADGKRKRRKIKAMARKRGKQAPEQTTSAQKELQVAKKELEDAERKFDDIRDRLIEQLQTIEAKDSTELENVNASFQVLCTRGIDYQKIKASYANIIWN